MSTTEKDADGVSDTRDARRGWAVRWRREGFFGIPV
jgi:hypothetical protein